VVLPARVTAGLCRLLESTRLQTVTVLHCNHPRELDDDVYRAVAALRAAGSTVLSQAVLLRGVNDDAAVLGRLSEALFAGGVLPYYLHLLDPVAGAAHFDVDEDRARDLYQHLLAQLPGYLVPKLVREVAGAPGKVPLVPGRIATPPRPDCEAPRPDCEAPRPDCEAPRPDCEQCT